MRRLWLSASLIVVIGACGGGEMSLSAYVDRVNEMVSQASGQYSVLASNPPGAVLVADADQLDDFTPQDLHEALGQVRAIEQQVEDTVNSIEPPERVADIHNLVFDFDDDFIAAQEALAVAAGSATDWETLSDSPEMAAYRTALAQDKQECAEAEAELNAIAEQREVFADSSWLPGELKEVFVAVLGCDSYPAHPEDVYRPKSSP